MAKFLKRLRKREKKPPGPDGPGMIPDSHLASTSRQEENNTKYPDNVAAARSAYINANPQQGPDLAPQGGTYSSFAYPLIISNSASPMRNSTTSRGSPTKTSQRLLSEQGEVNPTFLDDAPDSTRELVPRPQPIPQPEVTDYASKEPLVTQCPEQKGDDDTRDLRERPMLEEISSKILKAGQEFVELRGTNSKDPRGAVDHVIEAYKRLYNEVGRLEGKLKKVSALEYEVSTARKDVNEYKKKLKAAETTISKMQYQKEALETNIKSEKHDHRKETEKLKNKIQNLKQDIGNVENGHNRQRADDAKSHQREMARLRNDHEAKVQSIEYAAMLEKRRLEQQYDEVGLDWTRKWQAQEGVFKHAQREQDEKHRREFHNLKQEHDDLLHSFEQEKLQLTRKFEMENQELKGALVKREHHKGLADSALTASFSKIGVHVEGLSHLDWEYNKQESWPLEELMLQKLHGRNVRILKHQILQNSLWLILNYRIFSTPFRVLGAEGIVLDSSWFELLGAELVGTTTPRWPEPELESEQRRYNTAKPWLELIQGTGDMDDDSSIRKRSYNNSVAVIVEDICHTLGKVAHIASKNRQKIEDLVKMAATLWLEICSQRYRVRVILPEGCEDIMASSGHLLNPLRLIIKPALKRWGNSQGQDLFKEEFIGAWKGSQVEYESSG